MGGTGNKSKQRRKRERERDITPLLPHRLLHCRYVEMIRDRRAEVEPETKTQNTDTDRKGHRKRMGGWK